MLILCLLELKGECVMIKVIHPTCYLVDDYQLLCMGHHITYGNPETWTLCGLRQRFKWRHCVLYRNISRICGFLCELLNMYFFIL